jgi:hypothetical protein
MNLNLELWRLSVVQLSSRYGFNPAGQNEYGTMG